MLGMATENGIAFTAAGIGDASDELPNRNEPHTKIDCESDCCLNRSSFVGVFQAVLGA